MTRIAAGVSTATDAVGAAVEASRGARDRLGGTPADLALVFLSPQHVRHGVAVSDAVRGELSPARLAGCVSQAVIAGTRELEDEPGVAVWAASLPGATVEPFHVTAELDDEGEPSAELEGVPDVRAADVVVVLADPFTLPVGALLAELDASAPGVPVVGGIATGGGRAGKQALLLDGAVFDCGAVGVALRNVEVATIVSQGCRPLGRDLVITAAEGNVVLELAGEPALERLREIVQELDPAERMLAAQGLLAGLVVDENKPEYGRGDYLMRGVLGADEATGAIAVGELVRVGQTLRFHARDAGSADEDLQLTLAETLAVAPGRPAGALLFSCNGRGRTMFDGPDHDSRALAAALGGDGLAGFFCGGEIGPVGGRTFLHGFTATAAIFLDADGGAAAGS
jgi:small ligand-binding sensory domain FIST